MRTTLRIDGMHAVHAVRAVHTALTPLCGIVRVDVQMGRAVIDHDGRVGCRDLNEAISAAGFRVIECREQSRMLPTVDQ